MKKLILAAVIFFNIQNCSALDENKYQEKIVKPAVLMSVRSHISELLRLEEERIADILKASEPSGEVFGILSSLKQCLLRAQSGVLTFNEFEKVETSYQDALRKLQPFTFSDCGLQGISITYAGNDYIKMVEIETAIGTIYSSVEMFRHALKEIDQYINRQTQKR